MATATATAGFQLEVTSSGWGHLYHEGCDTWTSFVDPTDERTRWYEVTHRCGGPDTEWHESEPRRDGHRSESPGATAGWLRSVSRYVGTRPEELLRDATVWPAVQELAQTLGDLFPDAFRGARQEA